MSRHSFCVGLSIVIILALGAYLGSFFLGPRATAQSNDNVWYVNIGGSLPSFSTDEAMGFYPHLIVIDAGDTVVWTVVSAEDHTVTFFSGQPSFNGFAPNLYSRFRAHQASQMCTTERGSAVLVTSFKG